MKKFLLFSVLALMLMAAGSQNTFAQQEKRLDSAPQAFRVFFAKFKSAAKKSDKAAITRMTRFPFRYGFDAGDEGMMTPAQFVARFRDVFGKSPTLFMPEKNPLFSRGAGGSYVVSTDDATHLSFIKIGNSFKFAAYIVEP